MDLRRQLNISIVLYDRELSGVDWRAGLSTILDSGAPVCAIVLSDEANDRVRRTVLDAGGYDSERKPFDRHRLAQLVNSAFALSTIADSLASPNDERKSPARVR